MSEAFGNVCKVYSLAFEYGRETMPRSICREGGISNFVAICLSALLVSDVTRRTMLLISRGVIPSCAYGNMKGLREERGGLPLRLMMESISGVM